MDDQQLRELERLAVDQDRLFDPCVVIALLAEVRRLRCCGNCKSYQHKVKEEQINKHSCYVGNRLVEFISMPDPLPELICLGVDGSGKCEKWEAADNG